MFERCHLVPSDAGDCLTTVKRKRCSLERVSSPSTLFSVPGMREILHAGFQLANPPSDAQLGEIVRLSGLFKVVHNFGRLVEAQSGEIHTSFVSPS